MKQRFTHFRSSDECFDVTAIARGELSVRFNVHFKDRGEERIIEASIESDPEGNAFDVIYDYPVPEDAQHRFEVRLLWLVTKAALRMVFFNSDYGVIILGVMALVVALFLVAHGQQPAHHYLVQ